MSKRPPFVCPKCGSTPETNYTKYGPRHSCCDLWSWNWAPLVDARTHEARKAAHAAFDPLWQSKFIKRQRAYRRLARVLEIPIEKCHIKLMDAVMAERVPAAVETIRIQITQEAAQCSTR